MRRRHAAARAPSSGPAVCPGGAGRCGGAGTVIPTQRAPEVRLDLVGAGPLFEQEPTRGGLRRRACLVALLAAAGAGGAGWGLQQRGQEQAPVLLSVQKAVTGQPSWGTLAADLPGTSCGATVDWAVLSTSYYGVRRTLPCADGSEVRASIRVDDDQQQLQISLEAHAAALDSAPPHPQR
jgi:hypothetical protein